VTARSETIRLFEEVNDLERHANVVQIVINRIKLQTTTDKRR
jgi:hypothetical protein